ncbi:MAG: aldo/keto reductase [Corynebacterium sp.]|uniref:aldo/keto reductase n=1 Tax=Corynebacterium sp. TaxID=1720 RepID=UPI0026DDB681|nr:aldo/keto reductase [Corynebacterium sp.]MDO4761988.1 aldo/keto reductase [Corynebacterium sp.]
MTETLIPSITLNDGTEMPAMGLGTWKLQGEEAITAVRSAIELGYRHFDTAVIYGNEEEVGRAIADAIAAGDVTRDELFITSKLWHDHHGEQLAQKSFQDSLSRLGMDYLDCYMVHWPWPKKGAFVETFEGLAKLQGLGQLQSIAVANFNAEQLSAIIAATGIAPVLNQVELHPGFSQAPLREFHATHQIVTEAWSPLAQGGALDHALVRSIAQQVGKTPSQVTLRWIYQLQASSVPKSASPARQAENMQIFDFELDDSQMQALTALDDAPGGGRLFADPDLFPSDD